MSDKDLDLPPATDSIHIEQPSLEAPDGTPEIVKEITTRSDKVRSRQRSYHLDLRIHSPASLGYLAIEGIDTAPALVRLAKVKGLDAIGITDFYSGQFIDRVQAAAQGTEVMVVPGVTMRCIVDRCDDVTVTVLFPTSFTGAQVDLVMRRLDVPVSAAGNRRHLLQLPFADVVRIVESEGGFIVPSRMDKTPHRMAVIPALVDQYGFRSFDVAYAETARFFRMRWPKTKFNLCSFSNAHALAQVGSRTAKVKFFDFNYESIRSLFARALDQ
jgi:PHP family Zn ribbon phosphoesterase